MHIYAYFVRQVCIMDPGSQERTGLDSNKANGGLAAEWRPGLFLESAGGLLLYFNAQMNLFPPVSCLENIR